MMTKNILFVLLWGAASVTLAGCVSPEELRAQDEATCAAYGFQRGTIDFANCLQRENLARQAYQYAPDPLFYGPFGGYAPYGGGASMFFGF